MCLCVSVALLLAHTNKRARGQDVAWKREANALRIDESTKKDTTTYEHQKPQQWTMLFLTAILFWFYFCCSIYTKCDSIGRRRALSIHRCWQMLGGAVLDECPLVYNTIQYNKEWRHMKRWKTGKIRSQKTTMQKSQRQFSKQTNGSLSRQEQRRTQQSLTLLIHHCWQQHAALSWMSAFWSRCVWEGPLYTLSALPLRPLWTASRTTTRQ